MNVNRIFLSDLKGNPNKRNSHDETCLHILCSAQSEVTAEELELRMSCVDLLLQWSGPGPGPGDDAGGTEEKMDIAAVDEVCQMLL